MTVSIPHQLEALQQLRLPELQARYAEIVGEPTRCPNKRYLLRRIGEALEARAAVIDELAPPPAAPAPEGPESQDEPAEDADSDEESAPEPLGVSTPETELASQDEPALDVEPAVDVAPDEESAPETPDAAPPEAEPAPRLRDLDVEGLRTRYLEVVGRGTGSYDRRYLIWKIRQAQQGRVPVGPVRRRQPGEAPVEHKVLPLRMPAATVDALDEVWRRRGLASRMDLFRCALDHYLTHLGESDAAACVRRR